VHLERFFLISPALYCASLLAIRDLISPAARSFSLRAGGDDGAGQIGMADYVDLVALVLCKDAR